MENTTECNNSSDCTRIINGQTVLNQCFERIIGSDETFVCDCSPTFGLIGELCDQPTPQSRTILVLQILLLFFSIIVASYGLFVLRLFVLKYEAARKQNNVLLDGMAVVVFSLLSVIFEIITNVSNLRVFLDSSNMRLVTFYSGTNKEMEVITSSLGKFDFMLNVLSINFALVASTIIVMSWLNVILKVFQRLNPDCVSRIQRMKKTTYVTIGIISCLAILLSSLLLVTGLFIVGYIACLYAIGITLSGRRLFLSTVALLSRNGKQKNVSKRINNFSYNMIICLTIVLILLTIVSIFVQNAFEYETGEINWIYNLLCFCLLFKNFILFYQMNFVHELIKNVVATTSKITPNKSGSIKKVVSR